MQDCVFTEHMRYRDVPAPLASGVCHYLIESEMTSEREFSFTFTTTIVRTDDDDESESVFGS